MLSAVTPTISPQSYILYIASDLFSSARPPIWELPSQSCAKTEAPSPNLSRRYGDQLGLRKLRHGSFIVTLWNDIFFKTWIFFCLVGKKSEVNEVSPSCVYFHTQITLSAQYYKNISCFPDFVNWNTYFISLCRKLWPCGDPLHSGGAFVCLLVRQRCHYVTGQFYFFKFV